SFGVLAQSKSTITIKTITIQNGDTVITQRSYDSEGDNNIFFSDTAFNNQDVFLFFNKDYDLDTNFSERFEEIFTREMKDFFKDLNMDNDDFFDKKFDIFDRTFPLDMNIDSLFPDEVYRMPDATEKEYEQLKPRIERQQQDNQAHRIVSEIIISSSLPNVSNFGTDEFSDDSQLKVYFQLDEKKSTLLTVDNDNHKSIYKEKIPKSKGLYTRLFDFSSYKPGIYYLSVKQGKKQSVSKVSINK
ncbi:MAG: hypothetical protein WC401_05460, partial [Bacteroidales bacterium]